MIPQEKKRKQKENKKEKKRKKKVAAETLSLDYKDIVSIHPEFDFFIEKQEIGKVRSFDQVW